MIKGKILDKQVVNLEVGDTLTVTLPNTGELWYTTTIAKPSKVTITKRTDGTVVDIFLRKSTAELEHDTTP